MSKALGYTKETIQGIGAPKRNFPSFDVGDTIAVSFRIIEKDTKEKGKEVTKERIQLFQGDVIAMHKAGASSTFTVRKMGSHGISVERIVPFHSPLVATIDIVKKGDVRRAKLYYVRKLVGRAARIKEKVMTAAQLKALSAKGVDVEELLAQENIVVVEDNKTND